MVYVIKSYTGATRRARPPPPPARLLSEALVITRVIFHRFKQFADQSFDLHPGISLLGGGNNVGKSTILHGLAVWEFCRTAVEMERGPKVFLAGQARQGLGLGDDEFSPINVPTLKHLWTNLKTQKVIEPDGYTLKIACEWTHDGADRRLEFGLALSNDRLFVKTTDSNLGAADPIPRFAYLPPFAGITAREMRMTGAIRRRRIGEGLAGAVLRNILLDMDLMVEGSGFLQWLSVFALATTPEINVLLLDEPDAHLHSSLQEQLLDSLLHVVKTTDKQILVATHSTEILRNAEPSDILHVHGSGTGGKYLREESQKVGLLAGLGSDYAPRVDHAKRTKRILFVEGRTDIPILKELAYTLGMEWPDTWTEWRTSSTQKERRHLYLALREEIPELVALSLRDRDDEPAETVGEDLVDPTAPSDGSFHPRRWRRRYIESYLIWPSAIAAATGLSEEEVRRILTDSHGISIGAGFTDSYPPPAHLDVRAKRILKEGGSAPVLGQFDAGPLDVAKHIEAAAVCADIQRFLGDVVALA